ncbi:hypothetical protein [Streptomyces tubercidicus]|uniref:Uncharacterized protein n=1 Tax=Streptomyces tubercidicus TaxID=47759 RepID=A0A640UV85_9ACTN|nr:hypothetical protein [Streptomyces tubercidicus]WAU16842.1 hypothetical protein STRTU_004173 [Streptomyces tubercidicus]GFE39284.1 hypothetical protein Stube_39570 [Streptomyces tubercidicus]
MSTTPEPDSAPTPQDAPDAEPASASPDAPEAKRAPAPSAAVRPVASGSAARLIFDDPLNQQSSDDTDRGWGERPAGGDSAADLARFLDEKPPHHL